MAIRLVNNKPLLRNGRFAAMDPGVEIEPPPALSVLTLVDMPQHRVYQRDGTSKSVPVAGGYTGPAPAVIEARVVDAASGAARSSWAALIGASIANGSFSGALDAPQGGWYRLQVRDAANPGGVTSGTNRWGVGVVLALLGQSNMGNFPGGPFKYPLGAPRAIEYASSSFRRVGNLNDAYAPNTLSGGSTPGGYPSFTSSGSRGDGYTYLANLLSDALNMPVCLLPSTANGQPIDVWVGSKTAWNAFVASINETGGDCEGALFFQGESNAAAGTSTVSYMASLATLQQQLHTQTGRDSGTFDFGIIGLGPVSDASSYSGGNTSRAGAIRAAQVQFANGTPGAFYVTSALDTITSDGVHITGEGFSRLGRRYAKSAAAALGAGNSGAGPRVVWASRSGLDVMLTLQHAGGSLLTDGAGGNGSALAGFELRDIGGAVVAITGTRITSPTTIRLTVASAPATVSYGMGNTPHTTSVTDSRTAMVSASIVYDNATYLDGGFAPFGQSAVGAPLQPFAPINITGS